MFKNYLSAVLLSLLLFSLFILLAFCYPEFSKLDSYIGLSLYSRNDLLVSLSLIHDIAGSGIGTIISSILISIFYVYAFKDKHAAITSFLFILICWLVNIFFKDLIERPRPDFLHLALTSSSSLPSGHAMAAFMLAGLSFIVISKHKPQLRSYVFIFFIFWAISSGLSRIVLGVHYFTDVIAAFLLSGVLLCLFYSVYHQEKFRIERFN